MTEGHVVHERHAHSSRPVAELVEQDAVVPLRHLGSQIELFVQHSLELFTCHRALVVPVEVTEGREQLHPCRQNLIIIFSSLNISALLNFIITKNPTKMLPF